MDNFHKHIQHSEDSIDKALHIPSSSNSKLNQNDAFIHKPILLLHQLFQALVKQLTKTQRKNKKKILMNCNVITPLKLHPNLCSTSYGSINACKCRIAHSPKISRSNVVAATFVSACVIATVVSDNGVRPYPPSKMDTTRP